MRTTKWQEVRDLVGAVDCIWQDWQGFHHEPIPEQPPPTNIMWGWRHQHGETYVVRIRIDVDRIDSTSTPPQVCGTYHVAEATFEGKAERQILQAWGDLGQTQAARSHASSSGGPDPTQMTMQRSEPQPSAGSLLSFLWEKPEPTTSATTHRETP